MKGLIVKDVLMLKKLCKFVLITDLVFIAVALFGEDSTFFLVYPCLAAGMLPMSLISYDEKEQWESYAGTLPSTRAQLVSAKYIIGLATSLIIIAIIAVAQAVRLTVTGGFDALSYFSLISLLLSAGLIPPAVLLPFVFRFGAEKGRLLYYFIVGAACAMSFAFAHAVNDGSTAGVSAVPLIFLAAVPLYGVSWLLSISFYKKREL